jgi:hypothetical protein
MGELGPPQYRCSLKLKSAVCSHVSLQRQDGNAIQTWHPIK